MSALPIFTASHPATIVGANELNFCVQDGERSARRQWRIQGTSEAQLSAMAKPTRAQAMPGTARGYRWTRSICSG